VNKKQEEEIQEEIRKRVFAEEERRLQQDGAMANREALSEMSSLSAEEIDRIAKSVRREFREKQVSRKNVLRNTIIAVVVVVVIGGFMVMTQYNTMVNLAESVKTKWGQVENVYQRRLDLIPNLVNTVQAYADHEKELFRMVTEARAKAGGMLNVSDEVLRDPTTFQQFQQVQGELSRLLQRMMVVVEDNPNIKADQNFLALQAQLEGSENRIAVERKRFNEAVQQYNSYIKKFPQAMLAGIFGFDQKTYFKAQEGAENAPSVNF
jgi:LemA protein